MGSPFDECNTEWICDEGGKWYLVIKGVLFFGGLSSRAGGHGVDDYLAIFSVYRTRSLMNLGENLSLYSRSFVAK
jgi:hypothetical protein